MKHIHTNHFINIYTFLYRRIVISAYRLSGLFFIPSNNDTILSASATVIHLGRTEIVRDGSSPTSRPINAVEYNENKVEMITDVKISAACLLTSWGEKLEIVTATNIVNRIIHFFFWLNVNRIILSSS